MSFAPVGAATVTGAPPMSLMSDDGPIGDPVTPPTTPPVSPPVGGPPVSPPTSPPVNPPVTPPPPTSPPPGTAPTISISIDGSGYVPVNANRTSKAPWKQELVEDDKQGNQKYAPAVGLPVVRDFDVTPMRDLSGWNGQGEPPTGGASIADPELKQVTITVTNLRPTSNTVSVFVEPLGPDAGRVQLWEDNRKEVPFAWDFAVGTPHNLTNGSVSFYIEGTHISAVEQDIRIRAVYIAPGLKPFEEETKVGAEALVTVTPVIKQFTATVKDPNNASVLKDTNGLVIGINSGSQSSDGAPVNSGSEAIRFQASINRTGIQGEGKFVQVVTDLVPGTLPNGKVVSHTKREPNPFSNMMEDIHFVHKLNIGQIFPLNDAADNTQTPFYTPQFTSSSGTTQTFSTSDTPFMDYGPNLIQVDITFYAKMRLVFRFSDSTIYSLASTLWSVRFAGSKVGPTFTLDLDSGTKTSQLTIPDHSDPERINGPTYNSPGVLIVDRVV